MNILLNLILQYIVGLLQWLSGKESAGQCKRCEFDSLSQEYSQKKETAAHFSIFAWGSPWTERPGRTQFMGSQKSQT